MSKKTTYILIFIILGVTLVGLVSYYFSTKEIDGTGTKTNVFRNFFPFGGNETNNNPTTPTEQNPNENGVGEPINFVQKLRKLSSEPVAGAGLLDVKAGTVVRYIEKATGHIFEVELFSPRQGRISNTTIPRVYDAVWGNKNNSLIARYLKDDDQTIDTYSLTLKDLSTSTENTISGIVFPENISDVTVLGNSVFYLEENYGSSYGYISNFSGGSKKQIWNYPVKEFLSQYVNSKTVALITKPHEDFSGFMYFVDTGTGGTRKILGDIMGLSTLVNSPATEVLYLDQKETPALHTLTIKDGGRKNLTPTTFPEKCAWSQKDLTMVYCAVPKDYITRNSLTSWYVGQVQFTDDIWKYDLKNNTSSIVLDLSIESKEDIDVIKPVLSENEQYLIFMNKRDNSLWSLDLTK